MNIIDGRLWELYLEGRGMFPSDLQNYELYEPSFKQTGLIEVVVPVNPRKFLEIAYPINTREGYSLKTTKWMKGEMKGKNPDKDITDLPFLKVGSDFKIIGHEGRHRASTAMDMGYDTIPVKIVIRIPQGMGYDLDKHKEWFENNKKRIFNLEFTPEELSNSRLEEKIKSYIKKLLPNLKVIIKYGAYDKPYHVEVSNPKSPSFDSYSVYFENGQYVIEDFKDYEDPIYVKSLKEVVEILKNKLS
jgi:hypothetical protein